MEYVERLRVVLDELTEPLYKDSPFLPYQSCSSLLRPSTESTNSHSFQSFIKRMSTYNSDHWIQHPLSAVLLAKNGFKNVDGTHVVCCSCRRNIDPGAWLSDPGFLAQMAVRAHYKTCVWTIHQTPDEYFTIPHTPMQVFKSLVIIWKDLLEMDSNLPVVTRDIWNNMGSTEECIEDFLKHIGSTGTEKERSALILALCGWIKETNQSIKCHFCCKEIGMWNCHTFGDENSSGNSQPPLKRRSVIEVLYRKIRSKIEIRDDEIVDHKISKTDKNEHSEPTLAPAIPGLCSNQFRRDAGDMKSRGVNCNLRFIQYVKGESVNRATRRSKLCVQSFQRIINCHNEPTDPVHKTGENSRKASETPLKGKGPQNSEEAEGTIFGFVPRLKRSSLNILKDEEVYKEGTYSGFVPRLRRRNVLSNVKAEPGEVQGEGTYSGFVPRLRGRSSSRSESSESVHEEGTYSGFVPRLRGRSSSRSESPESVHEEGTYSGFVPRLRGRSSSRSESSESVHEEGTYSGFVPRLRGRSSSRSESPESVHEERTYSGFVPRLRGRSSSRSESPETIEISDVRSDFVPHLKGEISRYEVDQRDVIESSVITKAVESPKQKTRVGFVPRRSRHHKNLGGDESNDGPRIMSVSGSASSSLMEACSSIKEVECNDRSDGARKRNVLIKAVPSRPSAGHIARNCKQIASVDSFSSVERYGTADHVRGNIQPDTQTVHYGKNHPSIKTVESKGDEIVVDVDSESEESVDTQTDSDSSTTADVRDAVGSERGGTVMSRSRGEIGRRGEMGKHNSGPQIVSVTGHHIGDLDIERVGCKNKNSVPPKIVSVNCASMADDRDVVSSFGTVKNVNSAKGSVRQKETSLVAFGRTAVSSKKMDAEITEMDSPGERGVKRAVMKSTGGREETIPETMKKQTRMNKRGTSDADKNELNVERVSEYEVSFHDPSGIKKFVSTKTALQLFTTNHVETHQSSALKKQQEKTENLGSAADHCNNAGTREKRQWNGDTKHQPRHEKSDDPGLHSSLCVNEEGWNKWQSEQHLLEYGEEEKDGKMEWEALEYVPSAKQDNKDQKQIFENGCNKVLTTKSMAEAACPNGFISDVKVVENSFKDGEKIENKIESVDDAEVAVYSVKQDAKKHSSGGVNCLSSDNLSDGNEPDVDHEKFSEMGLSSMETGPQCSVPAVGLSCESSVDTGKTYKRKFDDCDDDDCETLELEKKCQWDNLGKTFFHPEVDHRFWCLWRIMKGNKKGWQQFLIGAMDGCKRMLEIYEEGQLIPMMKDLDNTMEKI